MNRLAALLLLCACLVLPAFAEVRLALVIDQTNYQHTSELARVTLASSEADQIEAALEDTGFTVTRHRDLSSAGLRDALDAFRLSLENAGPEAVGFLYYTGHGAQHPQSRNSFLLGTEARLRGASDLAAYGVALETQKDAFAATGVKAIIMVFDACRNVTAGGGYKSGVKGFGLLEASADMLIAYSTDLDDVAAEGIYAPVLAEEIRRPGQSAETLFANVQRKVAEKTGRKQRPWYNPRLYNFVCFSGCPIESSIRPAETLVVTVAPNILDQAHIAFNSQNFHEARDLYKQACDSGDVTACRHLAAIYEKGKLGAPDYVEGTRYYRQACTGGEVGACAALAYQIALGRGVTQDYIEARRLFKLACDSDFQLGCVNLGILYADGQGGLKNETEARRLYKIACDAGEPSGCEKMKSLP